MHTPFHVHFPDKYVVEFSTYNKQVCEDMKTGVQLIGSDKMLYIGIDMSKDKFDVCTMDRDGKVLSTTECNNDLNGFEKFVDYIKVIESLVKQRTSIGVESTGIYHIPLCEYMKKRSTELTVLNGIETKGLKDSRIRKTKTDKIDAEAIARYLTISEHRSLPFPEKLENLKEYVGTWERINRKIAVSKNQLSRDLDLLFPGFTQKFKLDSRNTLDFLYSECIPENIQRMPQSDIERYVSLDKATRIKKIASSSMSPENRRESIKFEIRSLIKTIRFLQEEKVSVEQIMKSEFRKLKSPIKSIPGIGEITGSIIVSRIGDIKRFDSPEKLVAYAGLDPVLFQSGKMRVESRISKRGDHLLRYALCQSSLSGVQYNPVLKKFYDSKMEMNMPGRKAITASARKLCHIIWSVWTNNKNFEVKQ